MHAWLTPSTTHTRWKRAISVQRKLLLVFLRTERRTNGRKERGEVDEATLNSKGVKRSNGDLSLRWSGSIKSSTKNGCPAHWSLQTTLGRWHLVNFWWTEMRSKSVASTRKIPRHLRSTRVFLTLPYLTHSTPCTPPPQDPPIIKIYSVTCKKVSCLLNSARAEDEQNEKGWQRGRKEEQNENERSKATEICLLVCKAAKWKTPRQTGRPPQMDAQHTSHDI
jgi:hypothetical protein